MKIVNFTQVILIFLCLAAVSPSMAATLARPESAAEITAKRAAVLESRLAAIEAIDKHALSHAEKKNLRREVRAIKKELAAMNGGVYLSVGAIILIALLLILLL